MKKGDRAVLVPTNMASHEFRAKVAEHGRVEVDVEEVTGIGVCTVVLPPDVTIHGHSHPLADGRHYLTIHSSHLQLVV